MLRNSLQREENIESEYFVDKIKFGIIMLVQKMILSKNKSF